MSRTADNALENLRRKGSLSDYKIVRAELDRLRELTSGGGYYICRVNLSWNLYRRIDDSIVGEYCSRDDVVDAWARAAKLPVCSICRCVHGDEVQHACE